MHNANQLEELTDIGDLPYDGAIRPVLMAIQQPDQLVRSLLPPYCYLILTSCTEND